MDDLLLQINAHIVTHSFTKQPDSRNYASTNPPHGSTQYVMIFGQATLYLSAGHNMVWALPFSWYGDSPLPEPQAGERPQSHERKDDRTPYTSRVGVHVSLKDGPKLEKSVQS